LTFRMIELLLFNIEQIVKITHMAKALRSIDPDVQFRVLYLLEEEPNLTQRELAEKLGISLGAANYCLKSLIEVGQIKVGNFKKNPNKSVYLYLLTPKGIAEKASLTAGFLKRKMIEYQALKKEIDAIQSKAKEHRCWNDY
jgi:EPS-associated MarR family transcriptional regulator